ncbi:PREDICTED: calcium-transporting ATPase 12, plasma membrane-type-like [Ipomoea nil]|uniref:calcium-transporting ATPase 12, plasma membrane-type-like n=1 Tax=Ipomoea nil TaxID=35883 RepID=UPI000901EEA9|nr:PREDICTED: calcium-transporting ATPase 12, plasma membrane-type-like [Ipomoea nil]
MTIVLINLPLITELRLPSKKRWRLALSMIKCLNAFRHYSYLLKNPSRKVSPEQSDRLSNDVDDDDEEHPGCFQNLDQSSLAKIVKEKSLEHLANLGGIGGLSSSLDTNLQDGIYGDDQDISRRNQAFGSNTYSKPPPKNLFHFVWEAFRDPTIIILLACAVVLLAFGIKDDGIKEGWYAGGSIFVAVFLVISVSALSTFWQSRQFDKLSKMSKNIPVEVVRAGRRRKVSIFEIVVGDIVCLKIGGQVPADGLLVEGHSLLVDESSIPGETDHVEINHDRNPFLISGKKVADGFGRFLVTSVGMNTAWGAMMSEITSDSVSEETPLQTMLNKLASPIRKFGLRVALFTVLVVLTVQSFTGHNKHKDRSKMKEYYVINCDVGIIATIVAIYEVLNLELLLSAVTLTLAYSLKRMMSYQAMVRKLSACETMGSATTICTDKTGTLTQNKMKVTKFWLGKESMEGKNRAEIAGGVLELFHQGVGLNTTGSVFRSDDSGLGFEFSGSPTEKAILSWAIEELSMDMEEVKRNYTVLHMEAFNSEKKRSGVSIKKAADNTVHAHWKGAAEIILGMCSGYYDLEGNKKSLDANERVEFEQMIQGMAASSLRCIAFAHKHVTRTQVSVAEDGLSLLGLVGMKDPCRDGVKKAIETCQFAGVNIKMITGDNVFTAKAIATECGILQPNQAPEEGSVIEGFEFRNLTEEQRMARVENIRVMARSSPLDKLLMVQCLKKKGHVVAVTGDGPALKEADIGLSMGIQGTEVAKESSDIVILDDDFATVAKALMWGRCFYNNIQKAILFHLTVKVVDFVINFVAAWSAGEVPYSVVQLLWVSLTVGTLGALALATEKPTKELMDRPPVGRTEPLITNIMWRNLLAQALYQISILLFLHFRGESIFGVSKEVNDTLISNTFILCQVFNMFNLRKLEKRNVFQGICKNKLFVGIICITVMLQVVMVEFLYKFADIERLNWGKWRLCLGLAAASLPIGWVVKCLPRNQSSVTLN